MAKIGKKYCLTKRCILKNLTVFINVGTYVLCIVYISVYIFIWLLVMGLS